MRWASEWVVAGGVAMWTRGSSPRMTRRGCADVAGAVDMDARNTPGLDPGAAHDGAREGAVTGAGRVPGTRPDMTAREAQGWGLNSARTSLPDARSGQPA